MSSIPRSTLVNALQSGSWLLFCWCLIILALGMIKCECSRVCKVCRFSSLMRCSWRSCSFHEDMDFVLRLTSFLTNCCIALFSCVQVYITYHFPCSDSMIQIRPKLLFSPTCLGFPQDSGCYLKLLSYYLFGPWVGVFEVALLRYSSCWISPM